MTKRAKTTQILRQTAHTFAANLDNGQMRLGILNGICVDKAPLTIPAGLFDDDFDDWVSDNLG